MCADIVTNDAVDGSLVMLILWQDGWTDQVATCYMGGLCNFNDLMGS